MTERECQKYEAMVKLALPPGERAWAAERASRLEERFALLDGVDTDGVAPLVTVSGLMNVTREDAARRFMPREELLAAAPEQYGGYFQAPRTID
ncbi:MAG: Asp-tRNA(Asn)/Glu-tRNA(Gln) amidotransferase subunit GatC [Oscillospiraceae bacterium]|nr:Asp-tRNA(Asn)/Glu-tRNA(Gln) amidotransferase subunit GatC [Oscillospiraceae bacterium]